MSTTEQLLPLASTGIAELAAVGGAVRCRELAVRGAVVLPVGVAESHRLSLQRSCDRWIAQEQQAGAQYYEMFGLPGSLAAAIDVVRIFGVLLLAALTASSVGMEYSLGTLRPILSPGLRRSSYLLGKLLALMGAAAFGLLVLLLVTAGTSIVATSITPPPPDSLSDPQWTPVFWGSAKLLMGVVPYVMFTGMIATVARSSSVAMATSLGYYFAEIIGGGRFFGATAPFGSLGKYLLVCNTQLFSGSGSGWSSTAICETSGGVQHAAIVLGGYAIVFAATAVWVFVRRDLTGPRGD